MDRKTVERKATTPPLCRNCGEIEDAHCPDCGACSYDPPYCDNPLCESAEDTA